MITGVKAMLYEIKEGRYFTFENDLDCYMVIEEETSYFNLTTFEVTTIEKDIPIILVIER